MNKLFAILLAVIMMLSLAACGNNDDNPSGSENNSVASQNGSDTSSGSENTPGTSQSDNQGGEENNSDTTEPEDDVIEDWTDCFSLPGLTTPEGFVVTNQNTRNTSTSDNVRLGTAHFEKDGGFTEDEILAFAQMIWDACMEVSPDGIYQVAYVEGKPTAGTPYDDLNETHDTSYGYYGWDYTQDGVYITIQVDYGSRGDGVLRLSCSEHR